MHSGAIELHRKVGRQWQREIEYREGFFTLVNYRNFEGEAQWLKMVVKNKSYLSIFPMKGPYNFGWLRENWYRNHLLAKIFYYNDTGIEIERKKERFKDFIKSFRGETFRRDTRFINEGTKNERIYVLGKGEVKIYKQMRMKNSKGGVLKDTEIYNGVRIEGSWCRFGCETDV